MSNQKQIEPTNYDKECMETLGRQAQAIQRITRYLDAFCDYDRRLAELSATMDRLNKAKDVMSDYDWEVYKKLYARMQSDEKD